MTTGRTLLRFARVYADGYDLSGYSRSFGPLATTFDEGIDDAVTLSIKGVWAGNATVSMGALNGIFDNTATSGIHAVMNGAGVGRTVMIAQGIQAVPAIGDPVFAGKFEQLGYIGGGTDNPVTATIPFGGTNAASGNLSYVKPWGILHHAMGAETDVNAANGIGGDGQTTKGGWMCYQINAAAGTGNITAALKLQHCATVDGVYADLLSTGTLNLGSGGTFTAPTAGIVTLATNATVESFIRWQIVLTLATSVTFALSFHRNNL